MSSVERDPAVFLRHIVESIEIIESYTDGMGEEEFLRTLWVQDAVVRRLEIIGEAVKNLPMQFRATRPEVPWKQIAGLRDVLIHRYFGVDLELTWEVVRESLPVLKKNVERYLAEIG